MSFVADTATLVHGYTMGDVERFARSATRIFKPKGIDYDEIYAAARFGVVERLYDPEQDKPAPWDLRNAGVNALQRLLNDQLHHYGRNRTTFEAAPSFAKFWLPVRGTRTDEFSDHVLDKMALPTVLGVLTDTEYEAIVTLAALESPAAAAEALGVSLKTYYARLARARSRAVAAWFSPETPRKMTPAAQLDETCRNGHARSDHGTRQSSGAWRCRTCDRNRSRRARARENAA